MVSNSIIGVGNTQGSKVGVCVCFCASLIKGAVATRVAYFTPKKASSKCCGKLVVNQGYLVKLSCQMFKFIIACDGWKARWSLKQQLCVPVLLIQQFTGRLRPTLVATAAVEPPGCVCMFRCCYSKPCTAWMLDPPGSWHFLGHRVFI